MENGLCSESIFPFNVPFEIQKVHSPPKIRTVKILDNPFDNIVPRITAAEKRVQQLAREQGIREREEAARRKSIKKSESLMLYQAQY